MAHRIAGAAILLLTSTAGAAQQPVPLVPPPADQPPATDQAAPAQAPAAPPATADRVFCGQDVAIRLADPASIPETYRPFIGIWSDASWTPQLCAALIVENVTGDGSATITYAFGPIGSGNRTPGGVLHGTGIVRDGELRFQNNDGSQYAFKPYYADLAGHLTTPEGQNYDAIFKKTY